MEQHSRSQIMMGPAAMEALRNARVAVFGLGGVGGAAVEALARGGIGRLELVDHDTVSLTNINRQLLATHDTVGMAKTEAARLRVKAIDPTIQVTVREVFYGPDTADTFDFSTYDYVVDAIDTVTGKLQLIQAAQQAGVPILCCMGTGNKWDPSRFQIADLSRTSVCPLARIMRKECAKRGYKHVKVLFSTEDPAPSLWQPKETPPEGRRSIPGSLSFVPPVAGMLLAGQVIRDLIGFSSPDSANFAQKL